MPDEPVDPAELGGSRARAYNAQALDIVERLCLDQLARAAAANGLHPAAPILAAQLEQRIEETFMALEAVEPWQRSLVLRYAIAAHVSYVTLTAGPTPAHAQQAFADHFYEMRLSLLAIAQPD